MGQSVHIFDVNGHIFYWNRTAERLYGYSAAEAHERTPIDLLADPQDYAVGYSMLNRMLTMGESWTRQFPIKTKRGERFEVLATNTPFYDDNGNLIGFICVSTDSKPFEGTRSTLSGAQHFESNSSFSQSRRIASAELGLDPQQPLQVAIASKISNLASKVSNKVKSKIKSGDNIMDREGGSGDSHSDRVMSDVALSDHNEDALSSGASSTPRGEVPPSPFGIFSHTALDEYSTEKSSRDSGDENDGKPGMHKIITSQVEAWMGKKGITWPWKGNEREASEPRIARFVWPWLHTDQESDSAYQKSSNASAKPESQVSDINQTGHNDAPGSWSSFNINSTSSVSSCGSTSSSTVNRVDVDTDSLDYEILWEEMTMGEQIGQSIVFLIYLFT